VLTTERTRKLVLKILVEGFLGDVESEVAWDKKLRAAMDEHADDPDVNQVLWSKLTAQVHCFPLSLHLCFLDLLSVGYCEGSEKCMTAVCVRRRLPKISTT
jgi:hypothetical protein